MIWIGLVSRNEKKKKPQSNNKKSITEEGKDSGFDNFNCVGSLAARRHSELAVQSKLGLLAEWWHWCGAADRLDPLIVGQGLTKTERNVFHTATHTYETTCATGRDRTA